jgi:acyl-CoA reductase-like NAD-dependent aldehyde dehydrogenase
MCCDAKQKQWAQVPLSQRIQVCQRFIDTFSNRKHDRAAEISWQMGKPLSQALGEVAGMSARVRALINMAPEALADDELAPIGDGKILRSIKKEPVGVVLTLAPWNYPLLTAVNSVVPAILAGNSVVLKHSERTPSVANAFVDAFEEAGLPKNVLTSTLCSNDVTAGAIKNPNIGFVAFTGSVKGGQSVYRVCNEIDRVSGRQ